MIRITANGGGFHLKDSGTGLDLWLDSGGPRDGALLALSHAHMDHLPSGGGKAAIASRETIAFAEARTGRRFGSASHPQVTLHDAGHMIGSRMIEVATSAGTVLYTGDFNTRDRFFLKGAKPRKCDILILDGTYSGRRYEFPRMPEIVAGARDFLQRHDGRAVFYGYSYGKAQLLTRLANELGVPAIAQAEVHRANSLAAGFGHEIGGFLLFGSKEAAAILDGKGPAVVVAPASLSSTHFSSSLARKGFASAMFTGWAANGGYWRATTDAGFCLSDHADFPALLDFVRDCEPEQVIIAHARKGDELRDALKAMGCGTRIAGSGFSEVFD